jgi:UDP-glucose 4-epimerase
MTEAKTTTQKKASAKGRKSTVMVTGAGGALARIVIDRLRKNHKVVAVDFRKEPPYDMEGVQSWKVDLTKRDFEEIFRTSEIDAVLHLGRIELYEAGQQRRYNANVTGTQKLLRLCAKYKVGQVLILSTYHVYGAHPYNPALMKEDSPLKASHIYHDLVDAVELENLAQLFMWKHPELNITILRPVNIVGPGINNTISRILSSRRAPVMAGFSPMMQFIHVVDMADAIVCALEENKPGIYNVAPDDVIAWQDAVSKTGCVGIPLPAIPPGLPRLISRVFRPKNLPEYKINYFKYPVVIDGNHYRNTFSFRAKYKIRDILEYYRNQNQSGCNAA